MINSKKKCSFDIILHQHDGCTLAFKPGANVKTIHERLQKAVMAKGNEYNIPIFLSLE